MPRIGLWFIGAKGGVATTAITGLVALKKGLIGEAGLVSALPQFAALDLLDWKDLVVGGHDIRDGRLYDEAMRMHTESRAISADILRQCKSDLDKIEKNLRPGTIHNVGPTIAKFAEPAVCNRCSETPRDAIERLQHDMDSFRREQKLAHLIVVYVASTEPPIDLASAPRALVATGQAARSAAQMPAAGQFAVCHRGARSGRDVHQFHAFARRDSAGHPANWPSSAARATWATTARRAKRC